MMSEKTKGQSVTVWMSADLLERVDKVARSARISRSRMIANLVDLGLDDAELLDRMGVIRFGAALKAFKAKMREEMEIDGDKNLA